MFGCILVIEKSLFSILNLDKFVVCVSQMMLSNSHTKIVAALLLQASNAVSIQPTNCWFGEFTVYCLVAFVGC